jgi:carbohydrate diacid regulator
MDTRKLDRLLKEIKSLTGITLEVKVNTEEELDNTITQLQSLTSAYKEKYNQVDFLLSLIKSTSSVNNINDYAKRLQIDPNLNRIMLLIDFKSPITDTTIKVLENLVDSSPKALIVPISKYQLVLLKPVSSLEGEEDFFKVSHMIVDTLNMEALVSVHISFSDSFNDLSLIGELYRESALAIKVGKLFYSEKNVFPNNKLGVGRLIEDIPLNTCKKFIAEVFGDSSPELPDEETNKIVSSFIKNNLNIAETARQLHMHRNTLIFRLEKIQSTTGLDLRNVEDIITFRIATMVVNYNKSLS